MNGLNAPHRRLAVFSLGVAALLLGPGVRGQAGRGQADSTSQWVQIGSGIVAPAGARSGAGPAHHQSGRSAQVAVAHDSDQHLDVLWNGTSHGGLWKSIVNSTNDRLTGWVPLTDNFPGSHTLGSFLVHSSDSHRILIGTGSSWGAGDGIYLTEDGGTTWGDSLLPKPPTQVARLVADRTDESGDTVVACTSNGIWRSAHFGREVTQNGDATTSWRRIFKGVCTDIVQDPNHPKKWYAGIEDVGVMYSADAGSTWCTLGTGISGSIARVVLAASQSDDRYLYASVIDRKGALKGVYRFDSLPSATTVMCSAGGVWTRISTERERELVNHGNQGAHACAIACDPHDPKHVFFGVQTLVETKNATQDPVEWTPVDGGHNDYNNLLFLSDGRTLVTANDGGYYLMDYEAPLHSARRVDDSGNLLGINALEPKKKVHQGVLAASRSDPDVFVAGLQDNGVVRGDASANPAITRVDGGDGGQVSIMPEQAPVFTFSGTIGGPGNRYMSIDAGATFIDIACGLRGDDKYPSVLIDPTPDLAAPSVFTYNVLLGALSSVYIGHLLPLPCGWQPVSFVPISGVITNIDHTTNPVLHAIPVTLADDFHLSAYFGPRFQATDLSLVDITPHSLSCDRPGATCIQKPDTRANADRSSLQPDTIYYTTGTGRPSRAFVTRDNGTHWTDVTGNMANDHPLASLNKLIGNPRDPAECFLATSRGVFHSADGGATWTQFNEGLRLHEDVKDIVISADGLREPRLYISTEGRGFWLRTLKRTASNGSGER
jgi:hypothetical protein